MYTLAFRIRWAGLGSQSCTGPESTSNSFLEYPDRNFTGRAKLVEGVDVGPAVALVNIMHHDRGHLAHAWGMVGVLHWRDVDLGVLGLDPFQLGDKLLRLLQRELFERGVGDCVSWISRILARSLHVNVLESIGLCGSSHWQGDVSDCL